MSFFLLSNLLTGFVNLTIVCSEYTNAYHSTTVIIIYMFVSCALITGAYFVTQSKKKKWSDLNLCGFMDKLLQKNI